MDIILLFLLACTCNLPYNNFIFILPLFLFNNQSINTSRNNLYNSGYANYTRNNINQRNNHLYNENSQCDYTCNSDNTIINNHDTIDLQPKNPKTNPKKAPLETIDSKTTSQKNNLMRSITTIKSKTASKNKTNADLFSILNKNYKGTCTIISIDGAFTGKIIDDISNIITLKLEDNSIVHLNKNSIISFY